MYMDKQSKCNAITGNQSDLLNSIFGTVHK